MNDTSLLLRSTLKLYQRAAKTTVKSVRSQWWLPLAHLVAAAVVGLVIGIVASLFGIVGSFAAGLALAFVVAAYLASLRAAVGRESLSDIWHTSQALFFPVIHVLFMFFILDLLLGFVAGGASGYWIRVCVGLLIAIFGNVLPELIYIRGSSGSDLFTDGFEFIVENWVEWFLPALPFLGLFFLYFSSNALLLLFTIFKVHPLEMIEILILQVGSLLLLPQLWLYLVIGGYIFYFIALFRAALFEELLYSSRRKRIYAERTG